MPSSLRPIAVVTPYLADANNGNWRTAHRWQALLARDFNLIVHSEWPSKGLENAPLLIALHAQRSAAAVLHYREAHPHRPILLVLTGTDLYHDLETSEAAQRSLKLADALVVLQEDAIQYVPREHRHKTHVIHQSARVLTPAEKPRGRINAVVVGHLRAEKSPETIFDLVASLGTELPVHILHIGGGLDAELAARAKELSAGSRQYHWAGPLAHGLTRATIKRAHLLIHPSVLEGGANVIVEAIQSGTAVLASRMSGNVGMLGPDYPGYFPVGDHAALRQLLARCAENANFLTRLNVACRSRAHLFLPETERNSLHKILSTLLASN